MVKRIVALGRVLVERDGRRTVVSHHNKATKGRLVRAVARSRRSVRTIDDLAGIPFTTKQDLRSTYPFGMFAVPREQVVRGRVMDDVERTTPPEYAEAIKRYYLRLSRGEGAKP